MLTSDRYVGLILAVSSSLAIGMFPCHVHLQIPQDNMLTVYCRNELRGNQKGSWPRAQTPSLPCPPFAAHNRRTHAHTLPSLPRTNAYTLCEQGLNASAEKHGFDGDGFSYLQNPTWWAGIVTSERLFRILRRHAADDLQWFLERYSTLLHTLLRPLFL